MSRSKRKPFIKDKPRRKKNTTLYWRPIRRIWNNEMKNSKFWDEDFSFTNRKSIINQYDYCDYWFEVYVDKTKQGLFSWWTKEDVQKCSRK